MILALKVALKGSVRPRRPAAFVLLQLRNQQMFPLPPPAGPSFLVRQISAEATQFFAVLMQLA
jgi:hypothetical protein